MTANQTASTRSAAAQQSASAVIGALAVLAVTLILVGTALNFASQGFRTSHHSSRWAQASHAAEAGAEIALMTAQKNSWNTDGWSGAPGATGAAAVTKTVTLSTDVPGTGSIGTAIAVDTITMGSTEWLRIRATGNADLSGGAIAGSDTRDTVLRKLSLRKDRKSGADLATPRASRTVEILAAPKAAMPFKHAFVSKAVLDLQASTTSDSYNSTDPAKSDYAPFTYYGVYDAAKKQSNGDIATTDNTLAWNLNDAYISGDILTPNGLVNQTTNVTGAINSGLTYNFPDEVSPDWTTVTQNHGAVNNTGAAIVGGTEASPTLHQFDSINLTNANTAITINHPGGETESWIEIWVTGDTYIDGVNLTGINFAPGVHATVHFGGRVEVKGGGGGYGIKNGSQLPSSLVIHAYGGSSGAPKDFILANSDFWGVVSAPWYQLKFDMAGKDACGSFLGWKVDATDGTRFHYDESLSTLTHGEGPGYSVRSWVEAVR